MTTGVHAAFWLLGLLLVASIASAEPRLNDGLPAEHRGQPLVWIPKLTDVDALSGKLDAPQWKDAAVLVLRDPATRELPKYETKALLFCTDKALYLGVRCFEPKLDGLVTRGQMWSRDEIEVFLEPFRDTLKRAYHHIQIDSAGEAEFHRYHVYPRWFQERALEEKWSPKIEIVAAKTAEAWSFEMRIPFDRLTLDPEAVAHKTLWRLNICRIRPARDDEGGMLWSWSNLDGKSFQVAPRFGYALPEAFASKDLIDEVKRDNAPPTDTSRARAVDPEVQALVDKTIADLAAAGRGEPGKPFADKLVALAREGGAMYGLVEGKLAAAAAKAKRDRARYYGVLRDFAYTLDRARPDDDPIPPVVEAKIAAFEARQYKDANGLVLNYRLLRPQGYDPSKKYPMLIWLHGAAEKGDDNLRQLFSGVWEFTRDPIRSKCRFFLMAPQCPADSHWADVRSNPESSEVLRATSTYRMAEKPGETTRLLLETFDALEKEFPAIDPKRIYISGGSMGGFGTWECIMRRPDFFAAAIPVCGGGDETKAALVAKTPIWMFHGEKDEAVNVEASRTMFKALKAAGGDPRYTEVPGAPHALGQPYLADDVMNWLFSQKRP